MRDNPYLRTTLPGSNRHDLHQTKEQCREFVTRSAIQLVDHSSLVKTCLIIRSRHTARQQHHQHTHTSLTQRQIKTTHSHVHNRPGKRLPRMSAPEPYSLLFGDHKTSPTSHHAAQTQLDTHPLQPPNHRPTPAFLTPTLRFKTASYTIPLQNNPPTVGSYHYSATSRTINAIPIVTPSLLTNVNSHSDHNIP